MRKRATVFVLAFTLAAGLTQVAAAADLGGAARRSFKDEPAPFIPAYSWSGLYVGAHVGYGWSDADWSLPNSGSDGSGGLLGAHMGYNMQVKPFVFGIEADFSGAWIDGDLHSYNWLSSVRGRAGIAINDNRTLLYATAGGAWADIDYAAFSERHWGWVIGGGVEHMLSPRLTARVEYLYYDFDKVSASAGVLAAGPVTVEPSTHTVRLGLSYKF
jgi:outer membrane immunogenic protein